MNDLFCKNGWFSNSTKLTLLIICSIFITTSIEAQIVPNSYEFNTESTYGITLLDGSDFIGHFIEKSNLDITFSTNSIPRLTFPFTQIKSVVLVEDSELKNGEYWFPNPNATRYFFSPSAFNLRAGEGYYQNSYLFFNSINYGVTDFFSIGGGLEIISTFTGEPIYFLTPKIGFELADNFNIGGGILLLGAAGEANLGITYGTATYGNRNDNATLGLGWGFIDGDFSSRPTITLSGMKRVKRKFSLVTENWLIPIFDDSYYNIYSYGMRFFSEKIAVDLGFINNSDIAEGITIGIPYVDFVVKF